MEKKQTFHNQRGRGRALFCRRHITELCVAYLPEAWIVRGFRRVSPDLFVAASVFIAVLCGVFLWILVVPAVMETFSLPNSPSPVPAAHVLKVQGALQNESADRLTSSQHKRFEISDNSQEGHLQPSKPPHSLSSKIHKARLSDRVQHPIRPREGYREVPARAREASPNRKEPTSRDAAVVNKAQQHQRIHVPLHQWTQSHKTPVSEIHSDRKGRATTAGSGNSVIAAADTGTLGEATVRGGVDPNRLKTK
ncbi:hypothetical protein CYMTET_24710 [Cymbomonas tetramitiformis]|uniref:Uncharacterized protein n=1 Tax=Cymbomonas tetramitiformis TaxID=36881 RepID=A0AAE0KZT1_9CHLO|nr:hypothetical protein CYMTET_24710 [Cymbomonas tetramitiformis]